jgi:flagellar biosynthesis protein FlhB
MSRIEKMFDDNPVLLVYIVVSFILGAALIILSFLSIQMQKNNFNICTQNSRYYNAPECYDYVQIFPKINLIYFAIAIFIVAEILFWTDDYKIKKNESIMLCTLGNKIIYNLVSFGLIGSPALFISIHQRFPKESAGTLGVIFNFISTVAPYIIGAIVLIYLNSIKYRRKKGR